MFVWGDFSETDWKDGRMDYQSRKHQSEIKSSLKLPRVTYSVLSRVRWLIAKLQVHGFLNKSAHVVQVYTFPSILSDTQRHKPATDASVASVQQKHFCVFVFPSYLCVAYGITNSPQYSRITYVKHKCATE